MGQGTRLAERVLDPTRHPPPRSACKEVFRSKRRGQMTCALTVKGRQVAVSLGLHAHRLPGRDGQAKG